MPRKNPPTGASWEDTNRRVTFYCPVDLLAAVEAYMHRTGQSKSQVITDAISLHLDPPNPTPEENPMTAIDGARDADPSDASLAEPRDPSPPIDPPGSAPPRTCAVCDAPIRRDGLGVCVNCIVLGATGELPAELDVPTEDELR